MKGFCPNCERETEQQEVLNNPCWIKIKNCFVLAHESYRICNECGEDFDRGLWDGNSLTEAYCNLKEAYESIKVF